MSHSWKYFFLIDKIEFKSLLTPRNIIGGKKYSTDIESGFLLYSNHDVLFDGDFITFEDDVRIIISKRVSTRDCTFTNVNTLMRISINEKKKYIDYRRKHVFG